jgi:hypothetical protein
MYRYLATACRRPRDVPALSRQWRVFAKRSPPGVGRCSTRDLGDVAPPRGRRMAPRSGREGLQAARDVCIRDWREDRRLRQAGGLLTMADLADYGRCDPRQVNYRGVMLCHGTLGAGAGLPTGSEDFGRLRPARHGT